jgi:hypothetical protein
MPQLFRYTHLSFLQPATAQPDSQHNAAAQDSPPAGQRDADAVVTLTGLQLC